MTTKKIEKVWVSSDNQRILKYAKKFGADIIKGLKSLSSDQSSSEDAWIHGIKEIKKKYTLDYVVALQASPIRGKDDLHKATNLLIKKIIVIV